MTRGGTGGLEGDGYRRIAAMLRAERDKPQPAQRLRSSAATIALAGLFVAAGAFSPNFHDRVTAGSSLSPRLADDFDQNIEEQRMASKTFIGIGAAAATLANAALGQNLALNLDSGGHVLIPHHASQLPGANMTIEFWMRSLPNSAGRPVSKRPGNSGCYSIAVSPANAQGIQGTAAEFFSCGNVALIQYSPAKWQHFAFVCEGGVSIRYYLNGVLVDSAAAPPCTITPGTYSLCFGVTPGYPEVQFFGRLDNIRIWSTARTAAQIAANALVEFTPQQASAQPGLIGSWSFNGANANDARGINNGTLQSGASIIADDRANAAADCNANGLLDAYELSIGALADQNANGVPDCCESMPLCVPCAGDVDGNGVVNGVDLAAVLTAWGSSGAKYPGSDANRDGVVDGGDLSQVLSDWGSCPN